MKYTFALAALAATLALSSLASTAQAQTIACTGNWVGAACGDNDPSGGQGGIHVPPKKPCKHEETAA